MENEQKALSRVDKIKLSSDETSELTTGQIVHAFNKFYRFFHTWSKIVGIATLVIWTLYLIIGSIDNSAKNQEAIESFQKGATATIKTVYFNPHWEVMVAGILILIIGLFLAYISAAISKYFELRENK